MHGGRDPRAEGSAVPDRPTSGRHVASTAALGLRGDVLSYDDVGFLPRSRGVILVDPAGDPILRSAVHDAARGVLRAPIMVGATHSEVASLEECGLTGPEPVLFFAPTAAQERSGDLGQAALARRLGSA